VATTQSSEGEGKGQADGKKGQGPLPLGSVHG
jgi:hypothetical protein